MYPFGKKLSRVHPYAYFMLPLSLFTLFYLYPSVMTIVYSFTDVTTISSKQWHFIGWDNFRSVFHSGNSHEYLTSMKRTLYFTFMVTFIQNSLGLLLAVVLNQKLRGDRFFRAVFFLPVVLGVTITALIWTLMMDPISGPVQKMYSWFGYQDLFFGSFDHAFNYVIFVQIWMYLGYSMLIFLAGLQSIPKDLYEAGQIDGTNRWHSFRYITFPLIAPAITVNVLLSMIGAMQTYDIVYALTTGSFNTRTIGFDVYQETFRSGKVEMGRGAALAVAQFLLVLIFVVIAQHFLRKREGDSA